MCVVLMQMCVGALVRRAGIFAGEGHIEKSKTCIEKAEAIDSNAVDIYIHRARVSGTSEYLNDIVDVHTYSCTCDLF